MIAGLTGLRLYGAIGAVVALAVLVAWIWRLDERRAHWRAEAEALSAWRGEVQSALGTALGGRIDWRSAPRRIGELAASRREWQTTAEIQSARITDLAAETARLKTMSTEARATAEAAMRRRDEALRRFDTMALDRRERGDCARDLREAEAVLDALREAGL